jgi:hypothetical protein
MVGKLEDGFTHSLRLAQAKLIAKLRFFLWLLKKVIKIG